MNFDYNTLLAGGIFAAIAGFWQQVKSVIRQVSSLVVIHSSLDASLIFYVRQYLKRDWKRIETGRRFYMQHSFSLPKTIFVPFRLILGTTVYYRGREFIFYNGESIISIRGFCDVDRIIAKALEQGLHHEVEFNKLSSRYSINRIFGREKGAGSYRGNSNSTDLAGDDSSAPRIGSGSSRAEVSGSGTPALDYQLDKSFLYAREEYIQDYTYDPFAHLYYSEDVMKHIQRAQHWITMGDWYNERMIPWRRGWALEGPGGTGKSSLAKALAESMRVPIYDFKLGTLSDQEFYSRWRDMALPAVVLFEDFDAVFKLRESLTEHKSLTFDTILNAVSGIESLSGVFLIVTTNHIENIDPAMGVASDVNGVSTRPGRIDTVIHLGFMNETNRRKMANRILKDWPHLIDAAIACGDEVTPVQFQEICTQVAFDEIHKALALKETIAS